MSLIRDRMPKVSISTQLNLRGEKITAKAVAEQEKI